MKATYTFWPDSLPKLDHMVYVKEVNYAAAKKRVLKWIVTHTTDKHLHIHCVQIGVYCDADGI